MKTAFIIGTTLVATGIVVAYICLKNKNKNGNQKTSKLSSLKNFFRIKPQFEIRETDRISLKVFGSWIKEHDFPSFTGYKFFIIKDQNLIGKDKNPNNLIVHGFCITDAEFNVIDACVYLSKDIDSSFASRVVEEVNEIVIK